MLTVRNQSSPFWVIRTLSIFCALFCAETGWAFTGTVSSTSAVGSNQISVTVSNTDNSETITITVTNAPTSPSPTPVSPSPPSNHSPVLAALGAQNVIGGHTLSFTLSATDPDGDSLTYSATGLPAGAIFNATSGAFSWNSPRIQTASRALPPIVFSVSDGKGGTDSETVGITVSQQPNTGPPVLSSIGDRAVNVGTNLNFVISAVDPDADIVTLTVTGLPTGATFTPGNAVIDPSGGITYMPPPTFSWTPTATEVGNHTVTFVANDGRGSTVSQTITIAVTSP